MQHTIIWAMFIVGFLLIVAVLMQPQKQRDALSALTGGADELFAQTKARGFEAVMQRITWILGGIWLLLGFILMIISAK